MMNGSGNRKFKCRKEGATRWKVVKAGSPGMAAEDFGETYFMEDGDVVEVYQYGQWELTVIREYLADQI